MKNAGKYIVLVIVLGIAGANLGKLIGRHDSINMYNASLARNSNAYEEIEQSSKKIDGIDYINNQPGFYLLIPDGFTLHEVLNNGGIIVKEATNGKERIQIRIVDIYSVVGDTSKTRDKYSFNEFMKNTMQSWYEESIESFLNSKEILNLEKKNIEKSIKKLGGNIFIYLKYDYIDAMKNNITRTSYSFLQDGYTIDIVVYTNTENPNKNTIDCLNSFKYM